MTKSLSSICTKGSSVDEQVLFFYLLLKQRIPYWDNSQVCHISAVESEFRYMSLSAILSQYFACHHHFALLIVILFSFDNSVEFFSLIHLLFMTQYLRLHHLSFVILCFSSLGIFFDVHGLSSCDELFPVLIPCCINFPYTSKRK